MGGQDKTLPGSVMSRHQTQTQTRGWTRDGWRVSSFIGCFMKIHLSLALDAIVSWFWFNISHFGHSDDGCKSKTESPVFWF